MGADSALVQPRQHTVAASSWCLESLRCLRLLSVSIVSSSPFNIIRPSLVHLWTISCHFLRISPPNPVIRISMGWSSFFHRIARKKQESPSFRDQGGAHGETIDTDRYKQPLQAFDNSHRERYDPGNSHGGSYDPNHNAGSGHLGGNHGGGN